MGAERGSRGSQVFLNPGCDWVRAAEHAPRGRCQILERRHALAQIIERGAVGSDERPRKGRTYLHGLTGLHRAIQYEDLEAIRTALDGGADVEELQAIHDDLMRPEYCPPLVLAALVNSTRGARRRSIHKMRLGAPQSI